MSGQGRWFVLSAEDQDIGCPCLEQRFLVTPLSELAKILGEQAAEDPDLEGVYWLDGDELAAFEIVFGVGAAFHDFDTVAVRPWRSNRDIPYLCHTGFELFLLLEGRKQLAQFADVPGEWFDDQLRPFERHVLEGRLVRRVLDQPMPAELQARQIGPEIHSHTRHVLFAPPAQEWRIDAYLLLGDVARMTGWNDTLETLEGALYGYEEWQIEWWLKHRREQRTEFQAAEPVDGP